MELAAQIIGIVVTVLCVLATQLKRKWQILLVSLSANFLNVIMFFLLNGITSAVMVSVTATVQCAVNLVLTCKGKEASLFQKILFTVLYLVGGVLQYTGVLDVLPIVASMFFMLTVFQKKEQHMRWFSAVNVTIWIVYHSIIGTTAVWGQVFALISTSIALYRYRKTS